MDILFVCKANVGRSQMAEALFRKYKSGKALSAGMDVDKPGETLYQYSRRDPVALHVLTVMNDEGVDVSGHIRQGLDEFDLSNFDYVIALTEELPRELEGVPNAIHWKIADGKGRSLQFHYDLRDEIKRRIQDTL